MDDLISRQDLFAEMKQMYEAAEKWKEDAKEYEIRIRAESCLATLIEMKLRVEAMPPAQKTGIWIHERLASTVGGSYPIVRCSACMGDMPFEWPTKYCPHCGAKMEREQR